MCHPPLCLRYTPLSRYYHATLSRLALLRAYCGWVCVWVWVWVRVRCCVQVKLVRMLDFDPRLSLVSRTVSAAWSELAFFMLSCGLIVFGYGLAGSIIFGEEHAEFWDPPSAIGAHRTVGYVSIYIYIVLAVVVANAMLLGNAPR